MQPRVPTRSSCDLTQARSAREVGGPKLSSIMASSKTWGTYAVWLRWGMASGSQPSPIGCSGLVSLAVHEQHRLSLEVALGPPQGDVY
jgi:hypothetical protein